MAEIFNKRRRNSKTYDIGGGQRKFVAGFAPLHYDALDSGVFDKPVNFTPQATSAPLDGWVVTQAGYHYSVGKKNGQDGWFGFGGRQGQNHVFFRLIRMGYVHFPTRQFEDLSGAPTYSRSNLSSVVEKFDTGEEQLPIGLNASWKNIWSGAGGKEVRIDLDANGERLKLDVVLNAAMREAIPAPSTPVSSTYFGMVFKLDLSDIPKIFRKGLQNTSIDFDDSDGLPTELRDAADRVLAFMPIDYAYAGSKDNEQKVKLTKRIWVDTDNQFGGGNYMFVGAKVAQLNTLPAGDIRFDPTFGPGQVSVTTRDGQEENDTGWAENGADSDGNRVGFITNTYDMGMSWTNVTVPNAATITSATIEIFMKWQFSSSDIVTKMQGFDVDNVGVFSTTNRPSQIAQTTATILRTYTNASDYVDESWLSLDDAKTIIQEIVDRAGWASGNALGVVLKEDGSGGTNRWQFQDYGRNTSQAAKITIVYSSGGGGTAIATNRTEEGDAKIAAIKSLIQITNGRAEEGDAKIAAIKSLIQITNGRTEEGDTRVVSIVAVELTLIATNRTEEGNTTSAVIKSLIQITNGRTEEGDDTSAAIKSLIQITNGRTEEGDAKIAAIKSLIQITNGRTEEGDTRVASLVSIVISSITSNRTEEGGNTLAAIRSLIQITNGRTEEGDTTSAAIKSLIQITGNRTEEGDAKIAIIIGPISISLNDISLSGQFGFGDISLSGQFGFGDISLSGQFGFSDINLTGDI